VAKTVLEIFTETSPKQLYLKGYKGVSLEVVQFIYEHYWRKPTIFSKIYERKTAYE